MSPEANQATLASPPLVRGKSPLTDGQLVAAVIGGSHQAADQLVRRHWAECHRAAYLIVRDKQLAEDVAQEAMLTSLGALDTFDRRRGFRPWLHRIAVNKALDTLRNRARHPERNLDPESTLDGLHSLADEVGPRSIDIFRALAELDPESRAIVVCRHLLGYQPREIARLLELPGPTVRTKLRRALEALRPRLNNYAEEE